MRPTSEAISCVETSSGGWVSFEGTLDGKLGAHASFLISLLELLSEPVIVRQDTVGWDRPCR